MIVVQYIYTQGNNYQKSMFTFLSGSIRMSYAFIGSELKGHLVMDVCGGGTSDGTAVITYEKKSSRYNNQLWKEESYSDTKFFLVPKHTKNKRLALNVSLIKMLQLIIYLGLILLQGHGEAIIDSTGILFQKEACGNFFYLIEDITGKVLTVKEYGSSNGAPIITAVRKGTPGQKWAYYSP